MYTHPSLSPIIIIIHVSPNPPSSTEILHLLLRQARRRRRRPRPTLHRLPAVHALWPQSEQPVNHSGSLQRAALAIDQLRLCSWRDSNRAAARRGRGDDTGAGWRGGAGGYGSCCVSEGGGDGAADLANDVSFGIGRVE